jgi:hypothetical protein
MEVLVKNARNVTHFRGDDAIGLQNWFDVISTRWIRIVRTDGGIVVGWGQRV